MRSTSGFTALATISEDSVLDSDWGSFSSSASSNMDTASSSLASCTIRCDTSEATTATPQGDGNSCIKQWRKGCRNTERGRRICVSDMPPFEEQDLLDALRFWGVTGRVVISRGAAQGQVMLSLKHTSDALVAMSQLDGMQLFGHIISAQIVDS